MPGGGKSTVGREIARRLDWPFADCDKVVEARVGCTVAAFFEREGEGAFRIVEAAVLAMLVDAGLSVIATGGGAVLRADNRDLLKARTRCVYLSARPEFLWRRLRRDRRRPLLQVPDPLGRLVEMSREREPLYRATASAVVDVEGRPFQHIVEEVLQALHGGNLP